MEEKEYIEHEKLRHKNKMKELEYQRDTFKMTHELELERLRIKSAEIRRSQERKRERYEN